jgi:hypothetical protein
VNNIVKDPIQKIIVITNWIILFVFLIPSLFFFPFKFALGILLGGFISIINFHWLGRNLESVFKNLSGNAKGPVMVKYYIRLALTGVVLYLLISADTVNIIGLIVGLSVVVINIILTVITTAFSKKNILEEVS